MRDLSVKYLDKDGNTKWKTIGYLMENDKGMFGMITVFGAPIKFSVFEHKEKVGQSKTVTYAELNDSVPF